MPDFYASFAGQQRGYGCTYTLGLGSQPGQARISAPPDFGKVTNVGNLVLYFGRSKLVLRECKLEAPNSPTSTTASPSVQWTILDRRWKWQFGEKLDGSYNFERKSDGKLLREKSPRELGKLIFAALGEHNADVSKLPTKPRPPRVWRADDPEEELNRLCQEFDCAPGYDPWNDRAYIVKLGTGDAPPNVPYKSRTDAKTSPAIPDAIEIIGANTLYQTALKITTWLALEVDGKYVDQDSVSYKPATGWMPYVVGGKTVFANLNTTYVDKATGKTLHHRDLAEQSVFRVARVKEQAAGGFAPAELKGKPNAPQSMKDIGPFTGTLLEKDPLTGARMPAYVRGVFLDPKSLGTRNTKPGSRYDGTVSINNDLKSVTFDKPVFKIDENLRAVPATDLELIAAYEVSHEGVPIYYTRREKIRGKTYGAGDHREDVDSIVREVIEKTASATGAAVDNKVECDKQADYYIDELKDRYIVRPATQLVLSGIEHFVPDGKIRSVTWSGSTTATPETVVAFDCERNHYVTPYEQRPDQRLRRQTEAAARKAARAAARADSRDRAQRNVTV